MPAHGHQEKLDLVLAALSVQSYPSELLEVIVVDDGSPDPLVLGPVVPDHVRLIRASEEAWGSGHAVNCGVAEASGDVVLRLDADMLVFRDHVESQLRWHHQLDYAAVLGHKLFVAWDPERHTPEQVRDEVAAGRAEELFDAAKAGRHWIERTLARTNGLRDADHRSYTAFVGCTGSLHRSLFDAAGGLDPDLALGGDTEFAHRLYQRGAVFVPDTDTSSWHLGRTQMQTHHDAGVRYRKPYLANRVPEFHHRRFGRVRLWEVPAAEAVVDATENVRGAEATATALLEGTTPDLRIHLVVPAEGEHAAQLAEVYLGEPRVHIAEHMPETDPRVPHRLVLPAGVLPAPACVADLVAEAGERRVGLLYVVLPGASGTEQTLRLERTGAFARARHLEPEADGPELDRVVEEVHGMGWLPWERFVHPPGTDLDAFPRADPEDLIRRVTEAREQERAARARVQRAERRHRWLAPGLRERIQRALGNH
ncbi:glycosyltransferase family 2 protein [Nocardiopsis sp. HNM0947]|uniref:Glycosyltransferase family 2 protein n=1 Tax=Nocardiopsis coralli TaxID=2772213 RepID=A0ABR9PF25_9ACTN|nr:glycosyltransferase family 2 protein [Nocardiopsis coralli]